MIYKYEKISNYTLKDYQLFYNKLKIIDKNKVNNILKNNDKYAVILSRKVLQELLIINYHIDYNNIIINYNQFGKPIANDINFNISHSHDYVLVGTSNNPIGVDIEKIRKVDLNIAKHFCTNKEYNYIINSKDKYYSFWQIYTLKEAYFKMHGKNLSNMKSIEFIINDSIIKTNSNEHINIISSNEIKEYIIAIIYK